MKLLFRKSALLANLLDVPPAPIEHHPRSKGLHVSDVLMSMGRESGLITVDYDELDPVYLPLGCMFEDWYGSRMETRYGIKYQPGERCVDGIYLTTDGWEETPQHVHEYKTTFLSSKSTFKRNWYWGAQLKCYCYAWDAVVGIHHMLHWNGNYSGQRGRLIIRGLRFTRGELARFWRGVVRHASTMEGYSG